MSEVETAAPAATPEATTPAPAEATPAAATPAPETPKESAEDTRLSGKFAALARKEREVRKMEQEVKRLQKEAEEAKKAVEPLLQKKAKAKENPLAWLEEANLDYDEITSHMLKQPNPQESKLTKLEKELQELKAAREQEIAKNRELEAQSEINKFKSEINDFIDAASDKYELVKAFESQEVVYNVILEELSRSGNILSFDEACELVENHLQEQVEANAKRLQQTKKVGSLFAAAKAAVQQNTSAPVTTPESKTLTNTPDSPPIVDREMTPAERRREAARLLNFGDS